MKQVIDRNPHSPTYEQTILAPVYPPLNMPGQGTAAPT
jgi:hypothetical protein